MFTIVKSGVLGRKITQELLFIIKIGRANIYEIGAAHIRKIQVRLTNTHVFQTVCQN